MKNIFYFLTCILSVCFSFGATLDEKDWSYFVFAQQWPPAACLEVPGGKCKIQDVVVDWSIHGLWPTSDKGYPSFCNQTWPFKPELLKPIILELEKKWPNIYADSSELVFWKHEWMKHGTCATSLPNFDREIKYFKQSVQLHDRLNIFNFLSDAGLKPDGDKPQLLKYFEYAIQSRTNTTVKLFCKNHKDYSEPVLNSMYVCMDKQLNLIDCDEIDEPPCKKPYLFYLPFDRSNITKHYTY